MNAAETGTPGLPTLHGSGRLHKVADPSVVWYGGMGHRQLGIDGGAECYRCGDAFDDDAWQECVTDCEGPDRADDPHYWMGARDIRTGDYLNECATCGARSAYR